VTELVRRAALTGVRVHIRPVSDPAERATGSGLEEQTS
jgi:hypothetical protein